MVRANGANTNTEIRTARTSERRCARASVTGTLAHAARQRPASSRTTRKDFWWG
jgi:hypothetical protein